jgi:hypothetical protein
VCFRTTQALSRIPTIITTTTVRAPSIFGILCLRPTLGKCRSF